MKKAIMYGGGNIGRGFIGKVFSDSGYEVCFLDIMQPLIDEMNRRHGYTVRIVSNAETVDAPVKNVRAVNSSTPQALDLALAHRALPALLSSTPLEALEAMPEMVTDLEECKKLLERPLPIFPTLL